MKSDDRNNKLMFFAALLVVLLAATCFLVMLYPEVPVAVTDADKETLLLWHNQALSAVEEGEYSAAESKARQILRSFPNDLLALKIMVMVLYQQRNFAAAEKICRRIIDNIAIDLEVLNNLGVLRWQQGDAAGDGSRTGGGRDEGSREGKADLRCGSAPGDGNIEGLVENILGVPVDVEPLVHTHGGIGAALDAPDGIGSVTVSGIVLCPDRDPHPNLPGCSGGGQLRHIGSRPDDTCVAGIA